MRFLLFIALLLSTINTQARLSFIDVDDLNTWEKMFKLAEANKLDVLVYVDYMTCADCKKLRKETFRDKELESFAEKHVLPLHVNAASEVGRALDKAYGYEDVPTFIYLNTREFIFYKHTGYISASELLEDLVKTHNISHNYADLAKRARADKLSLDEWLDFLEIEMMNNRITPSSDIVRDVALRLDSTSFEQKRVLKFVENLCIDVDGPIFQTLVEHPDWITDSVNFNWEVYQRNVFNYNINKAIEQQDSVLLEDVLYQINRLTVTSGIPNLKFKGRQLYLAELEKWQQYDTLTKTYLDTLPIDSVDLYEVEAVHLMEHYGTNNEAMAIALNLLRTGLAKKETFQLYYCLCLWLYYNSDYVNAYKAGYRAYELAEDEEEQELVKAMLIQIENDY